jgi:diguanylate cyclase
VLAGNEPPAARSRLALEAAATRAALPEGFEPSEARGQRDLYAAHLLPAVERSARRAEIEALGSRAAAQRGLVALLALHVALGGVLIVSVILPARRRIRDWVARTEAAAQDTRHRLLHDPLTHLPNGTYLQAHLERLAAGFDRAKAQTAVLRIDLDRFKVLRDTLGQRAADEIIRIARAASERAAAPATSPPISAGTISSGRRDLEDGAAAAAIAHRVQAGAVLPFSLQGGARRIDCSIGVTMLSDDEPRGRSRARQRRDRADRGAERRPRQRALLPRGLRAEAERRETLFNELVGGLERGELEPFFQPQIDLATGAFTGFEALVRWHASAPGPADAGGLPRLRRTGRPDRADRRGGAGALAAGAELDWDAAGFHVPRVGVNFALAQLRDPRLIEKIKWEVERQDIDPGRLAIEVLETVLIKSDADLVVRNLRGLASAGFEIELDDFGTGHASIQNLRRFMVNRIKIDRSFIFGIESSEEQQTLTASMIAMARALGIARSPRAWRQPRPKRCCAVSAAMRSKAISSRGRCRWPTPSAGWRPTRGAKGARIRPTRPPGVTRIHLDVSGLHLLNPGRLSYV